MIQASRCPLETRKTLNGWPGTQPVTHANLMGTLRRGQTRAPDELRGGGRAQRNVEGTASPDKGGKRPSPSLKEDGAGFFRAVKLCSRQTCEAFERQTGWAASGGRPIRRRGRQELSKPKLARSSEEDAEDAQQTGPTNRPSKTTSPEMGIRRPRRSGRT